MRDVVLYVFAGRRANMRLQIPFLERIVRDHPNVRVDIWNLARLPEDAEYLQTLGGERIAVRNDFYRSPDGWNNVWRYYARPEFSETTFCKADDDVVFIETDRFGEFVAAAEANPGSIISAQVVNNGAALATFPALFKRFEQLGIPLLDVHMSNRFAEMSHEFFFENEPWGRDVELVPMSTWCSINLISYTYDVGRSIAQSVGSLSPGRIADRVWQPGTILGDEGAANIPPRFVLKGFVAGHLTFGPQRCSDEQQDAWRAYYEAAGRRYLEGF